MLCEPFLGNKAVKQGAHSDTEDKPFPDPSENGSCFGVRERVPFLQPDSGTAFRLNGRAAGRNVPQSVRDKWLQPALCVDGVHEHAARYASEESDSHVGCQEFPSEQSPEKHHGDLIDQRRCDEKGHGDAHGDARHGKAEEKGNARAGTERGNRPKTGAQEIAEYPSPA